MDSIFSNEEHLAYRLHAANLCFHFEFCLFGMTILSTIALGQVAILSAPTIGTLRITFSFG